MTCLYLRPTIFGVFDGLTVVLGVLFSLGLAHPTLVFPAALGVGVAEGIGMAAGEWLSASDTGLGASAVIGAATVAGTVLPALPWLWLTGPFAFGLSGLLVVVIGVVIAALRGDRGASLAAVETFGVLTATALAVFVVEYFTPGG